MGRLLQPWRGGRLLPSLAHVALDMPLGVLAFVPAVALSALSLGLAIVLPLATIPFTALVIWTDAVGTVERSRARALLDTALQDPVPRLPKGAPWTKLKAAATSRPRQRQLAYCVLRLPLSAVLFALTIASWAVSLVATGMPFAVRLMPQDTAQFGLFSMTEGPEAWAMAVGGLLGLLFLAPWITLLAGRVDAAFAGWLLGPPADAELAARAVKAETGRTAAIDSAEAERRRIERDLHDGAQQRLVALAMDLGAARERLDSDPEGGKALVAEAHEEAKAALKEIRDLVRGIHPVILEDRGLDAALSAVVARSPVPVELRVEMAARAPESVESAAYFVVSEALANIARHSRARQAHVGIVRTGDTLIVEVRDDGVGGADPDGGTGLRGLRDRVVALGGTMDLLSPVGGPTTVLVELPCAS